MILCLNIIKLRFILQINSVVFETFDFVVKSKETYSI